MPTILCFSMNALHHHQYFDYHPCMSALAVIRQTNESGADMPGIYHQTSNICHTESQDLHVFRFVLQLSLCNLLKHGVKSRMKMQLEQRRQAMLQLHLSDKQFYNPLRCGLYWRFAIPDRKQYFSCEARQPVICNCIEERFNLYYNSVLALRNISLW